MTSTNPTISELLPQIPSPAYVLQLPLLRQNLQTLYHVQQQSGAQILLALKGFAFWQAFDLVKQYIKAATASSLHEAMLAHEHMGTPAHLCCPVYLKEEMSQLLPLAGHITFNSLAQYQQYNAQMPPTMQVALRVNPQHTEAGTDLYNPGLPGSRLGITADNMPPQLPQGVSGLHFHVLCENDSYALERTLNTFAKNFGPWLKQATWVNMGGGHLITRKGYDTNHLITLIKNFAQQHAVQVFLEPGEAFGWQTGFLRTTVVDVVQANGINTAMLNVSFTCHMPDCLEMPYKPAILGAIEPENAPYTYRMGGMSCLAGDFVGTYGFKHPLQPGDDIILEDMIHYTMVKTSTFNGINLPAIGLIDEQANYRTLKTFGYHDYKNRLG